MDVVVVVIIVIVSFLLELGLRLWLGPAFYTTTPVIRYGGCSGSYIKLECITLCCALGCANGNLISTWFKLNTSHGNSGMLRGVFVAVNKLLALS